MRGNEKKKTQKGAKKIVRRFGIYFCEQITETCNGRSFLFFLVLPRRDFSFAPPRRLAGQESSVWSLRWMVVMMGGDGWHKHMGFLLHTTLSKAGHNLVGSETLNECTISFQTSLRLHKPIFSLLYCSQNDHLSPKLAIHHVLGSCDCPRKVHPVTLNEGVSELCHTITSPLHWLFSRRNGMLLSCNMRGKGQSPK